MSGWRDQFSEPVLKIIKENPGLTISQIAEKIDRSGYPTKLTDKELRNGLRSNQMTHLKKTGKIENRAKQGRLPRWYIKE